jgi:hypothetical protein
MDAAVRRGTVRGAANTKEPETEVIGDTGFVCTNSWPSYYGGGPCGESIDYCAETGDPEYITAVEETC